MKIVYNTEKGKETIEISVGEFLQMSVDEISSLNIVDVKASHNEMKQIKELHTNCSDQYALLQEQYGYNETKKTRKGFLNTKTDNVKDYINIIQSLNDFKKYQEHERQLRATLDNNHDIELSDLQTAGEQELAQAEDSHNEALAQLMNEQDELNIRLHQQQDKQASIDDAIKEKQQQLATLQQQQALYEQELQQNIDPQALTKAYMSALHNNFDTSIGNIKGKVTSGTTIINRGPTSNHKLWVTNGAPVDKNGNPITTFSENGKVVGKVDKLLFPDMNCHGMYGVNYCSLSAVSCVNGVDKRCGFDILNTEPFDIKTKDNTVETVQPYLSGWENKHGNSTGESLSHRPDSIQQAFASTPYVSGATIDETKLFSRDGTLAIDKCGQNGCTQKTNVDTLTLDGVSLKDVYEKGEKLTDEKTGKKYYAISSGENQFYVKDGDIICIDTPRDATNTTSGFHTIMVNIEENGKMTFTAGNGDHVHDDITKLGNYYDRPVSVFHTSDFAYDKIASFDENTKTTIAQNLIPMKHSDKSVEITQLQAEIEELNADRQNMDVSIKQTNTELTTCHEKIESENSRYQAKLETLKLKQEKDITDLINNQNDENNKLNESIQQAAEHLFSGKSIEDVLSGMMVVEPKQSLKGVMKLDCINAKNVMDFMSNYIKTQNLEHEGTTNNQDKNTTLTNTNDTNVVTATMINKNLGRI